MTKKISIAQGHRFFAQERTKLFRAMLLRFSRSSIRERGQEVLKLTTSQLVVDPGCPLFLKRFHKHPSIGSAISCAHKIAGTSPSRSNIRALPLSRDIACLQSPSSRSPPDVPAKVARSPDRFGNALRAAPIVDVVTAQLAARFSKPNRSRAAARCHQIRSLLP